jgi:uncharacterized membrane protein YbhN (UPF0104 family)
MRWLDDHLERTDKLAILVGAAAVLALGAAVGVASLAGFGAVWQRLAHSNWYWLPVALAGEIVAYLGYTLAYWKVARAERGAELELPHAAALVTAGFGVFAAAGGFSFDARALARAGLSERAARARVMALGALEYAVLAPATAVAALVVLLQLPHVGLGLTLPWLIGVPLGVAIALLLLCHRDRFERRGGWRQKVAHLLEVVALLKCLATNPNAYGLAFVGVALYWLGDIFCLWAALHVFSAHTPPVAQLVLGYATGYALTRRTLPLGGAGIVEAFLPLALSWIEIALAPALLAVFAYRLINLWLPLVPALVSLPALRRATRRRPRRARPALGSSRGAAS